ncbi:MAG: HAMP domain-containing histidine kinase [Hyphomicrobiales bacterium]|nr:HAMP domain-containing histidine kinase [Hyphomicrobiales bacterium]
MSASEGKSDEKNADAGNGRKRWYVPKGLSGKLLILTMVVIMLTEIFVFIPSVANFRLTWLADHFVTGEAASLALEKLRDEDIPDEVRDQLLSLTQTELIVVQREGARRVLATNSMPGNVARHVEVAAPGRIQAVRSITEALDTLILGGDRTIRVFGPMQQRDGQLELLMKDKPLRDAMLSYAGNVLLISLAISIFTGLVVFLALRALLIRPMQRMSSAMLEFSKHPEDPAKVIEPSGRHDEIGVAEEQLSSMQKQLRGTMAQQRHLADLGLAVSKINHDLRNILASASLFSDRLTDIADPVAQRLAPRLVRTIDRAADYTKSVLAYGKSGEALPQRSVVRLHRLCEDVAEALALDRDGGVESSVEWVNDVDPQLEIAADAEQLFRVLLNLSRNAVQAMTGSTDDAVVRRLTLSAIQEADGVTIHVADTGPGFPDKVRENLFTAFSGSGTNGGTGLGLAIAAELVRAHGGTISLLEDGAPGSRFEIKLPKSHCS